MRDFKLGHYPTPACSLALIGNASGQTLGGEGISALPQVPNAARQRWLAALSVRNDPQGPTRRLTSLRWSKEDPKPELIGRIVLGSKDLLCLGG